MSFEIRAEGVDVEAVMRTIRERIADRKRRGVLTEEELRWITGQPLQGVLEAGDIRRDLMAEFRRRDGSWNFSFDAATLYRSSRGRAGRALEAVRRALRPLQKLFWNPNPMISALSRQSDLNRYYVHLFHNLAVEVTRLSLEVDELRRRNLELEARLEALARREKVVESMMAEGGGRGGSGSGPAHG